jgi:hypothetical protein
MSKGQLFLDGRAPFAPQPIPVNEWVRYEITTHIGDESTGDWTLRLTFSDGTTRVFTQQPFRHADWRALRWFGFTNLTRSTDRTTYFLDDMEISNDPDYVRPPWNPMWRR